MAIATKEISHVDLQIEQMATTPSTQVSQQQPVPDKAEGPSQAELDQMQQLVKYLKQEAIDKDKMLRDKEDQIASLQQAGEFKLRASRQERNQMKQTILNLQAQLEEKEQQEQLHQQAVDQYESQIADLREPNVVCANL